MVCGGRGTGLRAGFGECADVYESGGISVAGKQYGAWTIFSGAEAWAGGAGAAELECQVAWAGGPLPLVAEDGYFGDEDEFAVSRPANGEGTRAGGSTGGAEHRVDAGGEPASSERCAGLFELAGAARLHAAGNSGDEYWIVRGLHHAGAR